MNSDWFLLHFRGYTRGSDLPYLSLWAWSLLQWHQLELGLGLSRELHPGRVWDPPPGVHAPDGALQEPHLQREGGTHIYLFNSFTARQRMSGVAQSKPWLAVADDPLRWWTSGNSWIRLRNPTASIPTSWAQSAATGSNVSVIIYRTGLQMCVFEGFTLYQRSGL